MKRKSNAQIKDINNEIAIGNRYNLGDRVELKESKFQGIIIAIKKILEINNVKREILYAGENKNLVQELANKNYITYFDKKVGRFKTSYFEKIDFEYEVKFEFPPLYVVTKKLFVPEKMLNFIKIE